MVIVNKGENMKTFQETLNQIQASIGRIQDSKIREQAQSNFDTLPKDESKWVIKSYSNSLLKDLPATTSPRDVEEAFKSDRWEDRKKYYGKDDPFYVKDWRGYDIDPGFAEASNRISEKAPGAKVIPAQIELYPNGERMPESGFIEFDLYYETKESQPNGDLGTAQKYLINAYSDGTSFDISTFDTDNRRCKDANGNTKAGTYKRDTQYTFSESTLGKKPHTVISERVNEYGINSDLKRENHFSKTETTLIGGKTTEIESKQTLDIEGEIRKEKTKTIKTENGKDFEKTIKTENIDTIQNVVEKGTLLPGETLDLSKKGEKVIAPGSEVVVSASN